MQQGDDGGDCIHAPCTCTYAVYMHVLTVCSEYSLVGSFPLLEEMSRIQGYSQCICT